MALRDVVVDILLGLAVLSAWIGALGFARLTSALDRLHCVGFTTIAAGLPLVLAAFVADGPSTRAFKLLLLWLVALIAGAALNQAAARAIFTRDEVAELS